MSFIKLWFLGYANPKKFIDALTLKPAPQWGFYAVLLRSMMDSILLYLPLALLGKIPPTPSYLPLFPTERYYYTLIWLTPLVFLSQWLLGSAVLHVFLRLINKPSRVDQILNITGMASLVVGFFLVVWDWAWFLIGYVDQYFLGISHLVIDIWWFVLVSAGLSRIFGISKRSALCACLLAFLSGFPLAVIFMRSPF